MARKILTLTCVDCGKHFKAKNYRKIPRCAICAQKVRDKGEGPTQIRNKKPVYVVQPEEINWQCAERCLLYSIERFKIYPKYDGVIPSDPDIISDQDGVLANQIAARMSLKTWRQIVGASIKDIWDVNIFDISNTEWLSLKEIIENVLKPLLKHPGIGVARLTKGLHRKRPNLIPICDSVVIKALNVTTSEKIDIILECIDKLRDIEIKHLSDLNGLREVSKAHGCEMAELRILEMLYWVQYGPFKPDFKC